MRASAGRVGRERALIGVACGLALIIIIFGFFVLYKSQERSQRHSEEINYSADCAFLGTASEKHRGKSQNDSNGPNNKHYNKCNINLTAKLHGGVGALNGFGIALFLPLFVGVLSAVGIIAAVYVAGDRRAAERGMLQAGIGETGRSSTVRLANIGKTPVFLKCWADGRQSSNPSGPPDGTDWASATIVSKVVAPTEDGYVDLPIDLNRLRPQDRVGVSYEYEDVFGDVWRGHCWFTKRRGGGGYARDSETEYRK